ncbi:hypothetical protein OB236_12050 [Paenibacillus sp. WQ 127069]|uniref:Uncharacterized protein n=1 Tax=Paenibacillus baimaensis TaxID=2982185 RepID=A0ABT2UG21_9BACL|nr:hypothetical protein [Paenibacillus sp. WQ 127069]
MQLKLYQIITANQQLATQQGEGKLVAEYLAAGGQAVTDENVKIYKAMQVNKK